MHRRLQTNDAFEISFGQIISCRQGYGCTKSELWSKSLKTERNESSSFLLSLPRRFCKTDLEWPYNLIKYTLSLMMKTSHSLFQKENSKAELG
jgi:hypothetical protein